MTSLLRSLRTTDPDFLGYEISFSSKMRSLEIMHLHTWKKSRELEEVFKEEKGKVVHAKKTGEALDETLAFFEAYLNAFYSLLQIIAKVTQHFYEKEKLKVGKHFGDNFGALVNSLKNNMKIDPEFSSYLKEKLGWYKTLSNNRTMITHYGSAFLGFNEGGRVVFIDYPKEGLSWFAPKKPTRELERYLTQTFNDLFDFLNFYVNHFRQRLAPK